MKRSLCALLSLLLVLAMALPAGAHETAEEVTVQAESSEDRVGAAGAGQAQAQLFSDGLSTAASVTHNSRYSGYKKVLGIDVSEFQGAIDWKKVAADGVEYAIIRLGGRFSQSGRFYTDSAFETNIKGALAAGLEVGVYYFSQAITEAEAREEAQESLRILGEYKDDLSLPVFLDVEYINNGGRLWDAGLSRTEQTNIALAYCKAIGDAGLEAGVYAAFLSHPMDAKPLTDAGYSVWHAHWHSSTSLTAWYDLWQFSATGRVDGIEGDVDLDVWYMPVPESGFVDVTQGRWYYDSVLYVVDKGLFNGMGDFEFQPLATMNREMFVTVLYRLAGSPTISGTSSFSDVSRESSWYYKPVLWATQNDIVNGVGDSLFGVGRALSRQEMVTLLYRYAQYAALDTTAPATDALAAFTDKGSVKSWAAEAMAWAVDRGIINGITDTTLEPAKSSTRAQVAAVMQRMASVPAAPEPSPTPSPSPDPTPSQSPEPSVSPEPSQSPEPSASPLVSQSPDPGTSPGQDGGLDPAGTLPAQDGLGQEEELLPVGA